MQRLTIQTQPGNVVPSKDGEYVRYADVIEMMEKLKNYDTDMSPREAVINYIFDEMFATVEQKSK